MWGKGFLITAQELPGIARTLPNSPLWRTGAANAGKYCQQYEIKGINYILTFILWVVLYVTFNLPLSRIFIGHFRSRANPEIHSSTRRNSSIIFLLKKPFLCHYYICVTMSSQMRPMPVTGRSPVELSKNTLLRSLFIIPKTN